MKKSTLPLFAFLLISLNSISQNTVGLKAGINRAHQTYIFENPHRAYQTKAIFGYQFGGFYKAAISKKFSLATEANLSGVGGRTTRYGIDGTTIPKDYDDKVGYIDVPLMLQYNVSKFYISAGPSLALKLFVKSDLDYLTTNYNTFDFAGNVLAGFRFSKRWDLNARYSHRLTNIYKNYEDRRSKYFNLSVLYTLKPRP